MYKTKIDWADSSWNPVTGCLHGCEYCYARRIAERFSGNCYGDIGIDETTYSNAPMLHAIEKPTIHINEKGEWTKAPYPFGFAPTFHRYRLDQPARWTRPRTIFVCSMADLFGDWVPDRWIREVFEACAAAPQHRYLFLTKNPMRIQELYTAKALPYADNFWFGSMLTTPDDRFTWFKDTPYHGFVSIEPILEPFGVLEAGHWPEWVIIGAETGTRKGKVVPEKWWIDEITAACAENTTPVFMKSSIRDMMGPDFRQEYPWEV